MKVGRCLQHTTWFEVKQVLTTFNLKATTVIAIMSASVLTYSCGQSQKLPEGTKALTSPTVSGSWSSNQTQEFYYSFTSAAGSLHITLDTIGNSACQTVRVYILDQEKTDSNNDRTLYGNLFKLACTVRGTPATANINIPERRPLLMKVVAEELSNGQTYSGNYTITLDGTFER